LSERLRLAGRELDELDAVHPQRIGRTGNQLAVRSLSPHAFPYAIARAGAARRPEGLPLPAFYPGKSPMRCKAFPA
jgi:hypothetical protein